MPGQQEQIGNDWQGHAPPHVYAYGRFPTAQRGRFQTTNEGYRSHGTQYLSRRARDPDHSPFKEDNSFNLKATRWNEATFMVPPTAPPVTASPEDKSRVLTYVTQTVRSASGATWNDKFEFVRSYFSENFHAGAATELANKVEDLKGKAIKTTFSGIQSLFGWLEMPDVLTDDFCAEARYAVFQLEVDAMALDDAPKDIPKQHKPKAESKSVYVKLETVYDATTNSQNINPRAIFNTTVLKSFDAIVEATSALSGHEPEIGCYSSTKDTVVVETFQRWLKEKAAHLAFETLVSLLPTSYVGTGMMKSAASRLQECKMIQTINGQTKVTKIAEHIQQFQQLSAELDSSAPFALNLTSTFYNSLTEEIQNQLQGDSYQLPTEMGGNKEQREALQQIMTKARDAEEKVKGQLQLIRAATKPRGAPSLAPRTLMVQASPADNFERMAFEDPVTDSMLFNPLVISLVSTAEKAMVEASGMRTPTKCWGCQAVPEFEANCFHRFADCPNKNDPRVAEAAKAKINEIRENFRSRPGGRKREQNGTLKRTFVMPTSKAVSLATTVFDPNTTTRQREEASRTLVAELNRAMAPSNQQEAQTGPIMLVTHLRVLAAKPQGKST
jgi:hypothetical protein